MEVTAFRKSALVAFFVMSLTTRVFALATYTYTGPTYINASSPFDTSMRISGSFSLANPLASDLPPGTDIVPDLLSFDFSDGVDTYTLATLTSINFVVETDSNGDIKNWSFFASVAFPSPTQIGDTQFSMFSVTNNIFSVDGASTSECVSLTSDGCETSDATADESNGIGTWIRSVPEPNSALLLIVGIVGLRFRRRS